MIRTTLALTGAATLTALICVSGCGDQAASSSQGGEAESIVSLLDAEVTAEVVFANQHYVGMQGCTSCHASEVQAWTGSHHDLAMQVASDESVLGDFSGQELVHFGAVTRFYRADQKFMVSIAGAEGPVQDFEIDWVFGVQPLQQYLVDFSDGRKQVLPYGWDSRPSEQGGQRWFSIHPDEAIPSGDLLHWTKPSQNWNYMCAECHSTALQRKYSSETDQFATQYEEFNVSCEACHGPGSGHVKWAETAAGVAAGQVKESKSGAPIASAAEMGLHALVDHDRAIWSPDSITGKPLRTPPRSNHNQVQTCAPCHSRRSPLGDGSTPGGEFLDSYLPSLLDPTLYHADGQIQDEVYVWGSFVQSRMHHQGVTCSDCHDPHSLKPKLQGDNLCLQCHSAATFASKDHHQHESTSCVDCHMPETTYMVVDPRRDHSMRIPRPDLSVKLGTPNACNQCHEDKTARWAADAVSEWRGPDAPPLADHFAEALHRGRVGSPGAQDALVQAIVAEDQSAIAKATALVLYSQQGYPGLEYLLASTPNDEEIPPLLSEDALLRLGAAQACVGLPPELQLRFAVSLLADPVRAIRFEAVRMILPFAPTMPKDNEVYELFQKELADYKAGLQSMADRPSTQLSLGLMHQDLQEFEQAEAAYRKALELEPHYVPAAINLADFLRNSSRDEEGGEMLRETLEFEPGNADLLHALGLQQIRLKQMDPAVQSLRGAAKAAPRNARYALVLGVALESNEQIEQARAAYSTGLLSSPWDSDLLLAMFRLNETAGLVEDAMDYADRLLRSRPDHELAKDLTAWMQQAQAK